MQKMSKEKYWDELISYPDHPLFDIPNRLRSGYEIWDECVRIKTKQGNNKLNNSGINERADIVCLTPCGQQLRSQRKHSCLYLSFDPLCKQCIINQRFYPTASLEMTIRTRRFLSLKVTASL